LLRREKVVVHGRLRFLITEEEPESKREGHSRYRFQALLADVATEVHAVEVDVTGRGVSGMNSTF